MCTSEVLRHLDITAYAYCCVNRNTRRGLCVVDIQPVSSTCVVCVCVCILQEINISSGIVNMAKEGHKYKVKSDDGVHEHMHP